MSPLITPKYKSPSLEKGQLFSENDMLSIIVPCYNEAELISDTVLRLQDFCNQISGLSIELIFVDDGSRDETCTILKKHGSQDPRIKVIEFARNFGHQVAVTAGIDAAVGDAVVLIDADLQDPPDVIHAMIEKWREGFDVVYGTRVERPGESTFKLATARGFYRLLNKLSTIPIPLDTGDFRLMSRQVVDTLRAMPERDIFVRGMVSWVGFKQTAVFYKREKRMVGESKYPLHKMMRFAVDGILSFSVKPLQVSILIGFISAAISLAGVIYCLAIRLMTTEWVPGWAGIMIAVLFIGGVQLISLGIQGEYVGRIYSEVKKRPLYIVSNYHGFTEEVSLQSRSPNVKIKSLVE